MVGSEEFGFGTFELDFRLAGLGVGDGKGEGGRSGGVARDGSGA